MANPEAPLTAMVAPAVGARARRSQGRSSEAILNIVVRALDKRQIAGGCLAHVGCRRGDLFNSVSFPFAGLDAGRI